ncbi:glycine-rich domain-containing protein, partial [Rhodococcus rhodnii]|uniref:glycine-rich domain-containing protein n=1 Tax=Rhodococcus rhodnii TaxID=38312 RepID=UPI003BF61B9D
MLPRTASRSGPRDARPPHRDAPAHSVYVGDALAHSVYVGDALVWRRDPETLSYTAPGVVTVPVPIWARFVDRVAIGGGSAGHGGNGANGQPGRGGTAGSWSSDTIDLAALSATSLTVTVGAGGTGTAREQLGNPGTASTITVPAAARSPQRRCRHRGIRRQRRGRRLTRRPHPYRRHLHRRDRCAARNTPARHPAARVPAGTAASSAPEAQEPMAATAASGSPPQLLIRITTKRPHPRVGRFRHSVDRCRWRFASNESDILRMAKIRPCQTAARSSI